MLDKENKKALVPSVNLKEKSKFLAFILGLFIGLAIIVPGVSGSTIAIIFGLYAAILYAIGNVFNDFKRCVLFLIPLGLGAVIGFGVGFLVIRTLVGAYAFEVICLFVGLMAGALPAITREIKGQKVTFVRGALLPIGVAIPLAVGILSIVLTLGQGAADSAAFSDFPIWRYLLYLPLGFLVAITQIVPGLSATAILMAFGQFRPIVDSVSVSYILAHPQVIGLYAALGVGFLGGMVLVSRIFSHILSSHKVTAFFMISGLSIGSILSMFANPDIHEVYAAWGAGSGRPILSVIIGVLLLAVGFVLSFFLTKYELTHERTE